MEPKYFQPQWTLLDAIYKPSSTPTETKLPPDAELQQMYQRWLSELPVQRLSRLGYIGIAGFLLAACIGIAYAFLWK